MNTARNSITNTPMRTRLVACGSAIQNRKAVRSAAASLYWASVIEPGWAISKPLNTWVVLLALSGSGRASNTARC